MRLDRMTDEQKSIWLHDSSIHVGLGELISSCNVRMDRVGDLYVVSFMSEGRINTMVERDPMVLINAMLMCTTD